MKWFGSRKGPPGIDATGLDVLQWTLRNAVGRVGLNTKDISDPENVHQARVGTRRFRSALLTFRGVLEPDWADGLRELVQPMADELGRVRDADVLYSRLAGDEVIAPALEAFRIQRRHDLEAALPRFASIITAIGEAAAEPRVSPAAKDPARDVLMPYVAPVWHKLRRLGRALDDEAPPEKLHRVRILTKHARYAAETMVPVVGKDAERFAGRASGVQSVLGDVQDATFAVSWLEEVSRTSESPAYAFAAGRLAGLEIAAAGRARAEWPGAWKRLDRKKVTRWIDEPWTPPGGPVAYLVRHAKAGDRESWTRADEIRPLTKGGLRQADALVRLLRRAIVERVVSSPYTRCMQTVEPLAAEAGLPVIPDEALAEGAPVEAALALLAPGSVLCTHGDVGENLIAHLARQGVLGADPALCEKGSTWVLRLTGGTVRRADYLRPQA